MFDVINSDLSINIRSPDDMPDDMSVIVACGEVGLGADAQGCQGRLRTVGLWVLTRSEAW